MYKFPTCKNNGMEKHFGGHLGSCGDVMLRPGTNSLGIMDTECTCDAYSPELSRNSNKADTSSVFPQVRTKHSAPFEMRIEMGKYENI